MRARIVAVMAMLAVLSACGGGTAPTSPPSTAGAGPGGTASAGPVGSAAPVDLSGVEVCALLPMATVEALTGETGFIADDGDQKCFWAVPRAGVPQYVEIEVFARPTGLSGYTYSPGPDCLSTAIAGVGAEAIGGTCSTPQQKVFLLAWAHGVAVRVLVNEPKGALTPADLAAAANAVLEGLPTS